MSLYSFKCTVGFANLATRDSCTAIKIRTGCS